jgi:WD40 repeat protein
MASSKYGTLGRKNASPLLMDTTIRCVKCELLLARTDLHNQQQVWALTVSRDSKTIISGAADSVITFWEDCTEEQEAAIESARAELVLKCVPLAPFFVSDVIDPATELKGTGLY